jgi:NAD(P)-dependent dehydrogenase (short-subunit alcohol dehydrogenase family)
VIADVQDDKGARLADELGKSSAYLHADVSRESDVSGAIAHALSRFARLDCLYNNAGLAASRGRSRRSRWTPTTRRWACSCAASSSA